MTAQAVGEHEAVVEGHVRRLVHEDEPLLRDHLLRLDPEGRRHRFNGVVGNFFIESYAARCFKDGTVVIAYLEDGVVRGAAELHAPDQSAEQLPEIAFSVEARLRHRGVGSLLFARILLEARGRRYKKLRVTTGTDNEAMRKLALKFGAKLSYKRGEVDGVIDIKRLTLPDATGKAFDMQAELARMTIDVNRAFWTNVMKLSGLKPAQDPSRQPRS